MIPKLRFRWLPAYIAAYFVFLYLPILLLPVFSFNNAAAARFPLAGFTTKWYASLWGNREMLSAAINSLIVGVSVAVLSTGLAICAARAITRYRFHGRKAATGLIMTPLFLPEIIARALFIALNFLVASSTNYSYYLEQVKGKASWNPFEGMF